MMENGVNPDWNLHARSQFKENLLSNSDHQQLDYYGPLPPDFSKPREQKVDPFYQPHQGVTCHAGNTSMEIPAPISRPVPSMVGLNGEETTSTRPFWVTRTYLKPPRSVPSPIDRDNNIRSSSAPSATSLIGKPSVKNLLKRFDANNEELMAVSPTKSRILSSFDGGKTFTSMSSLLNYHTSVGTQNHSNTSTKQTTATNTDVKEEETTKSSLNIKENKPTTSIEASNLEKSMTIFSPIFHRPFFEEMAPSLELACMSNRTTQKTRSISDPNGSFLDSVIVNSPPTWNLGRVGLNDIDYSKSHNRNHSDSADSKANIMSNRTPRHSKTYSSPSSSPLSSRIPIATSRLVNSLSSPTSPIRRHNSQIQNARNTNSSDFKLPRTPSKRQSSHNSDRHEQNTASKPSLNTSKPSKPPALGSPLQTLGGKLLRKSSQSSSIRDTNTSVMALEMVDFVARRQTVHRAFTNRLKEDGHQHPSLKIHERILNSDDTNFVEPEESRNCIGDDEIEASYETPSLTPRPKSSNSNKRLPYGSCIPSNEGWNSPALALPGSYVHDDQSSPAVSSVTENDNEPQIEAKDVHRKTSNSSLLYDYVAYTEDQNNFGETYDGIEHLTLDSSQNSVTGGNMPNIDETDSSKSDGENQSPKALEKKDDAFKTSHSESIPQCFSPTVSQSRRSSEAFTTDKDGANQYCSPKIVNSSNQRQSGCKTEEFEKSLQVSTDDRRDSNTSSDSGALQTPLTETYYEALENSFIDLNTLNKKSCVKQGLIKSQHRESNCDNSPEKRLLSHQVSPPSPEERGPTPPPKSPQTITISRSNIQINSPIPSPRYPKSLVSPLLPPLVTGEGFSFTFARNDAANLNSSKASTSEYAQNSSPFRRSASTPRRQCTPSPDIRMSRANTGAATRTLESTSSACAPYSRRASISTPRSCARNSLEKHDPFVNPNEDLTSHPETEEEKRYTQENCKRLYQRSMVIKELIDTEAVYLKDMNVIEEIYKGTAEACPNLQSSDIKIIFRNTEEIVTFSGRLLEDLKLAAFSIYASRGRKVKTNPSNTLTSSTDTDGSSVAASLNDESEEQRDRKTCIGASFCRHLSQMQVIYTEFLKNSEAASSRLADLQKDTAVKVWLGECNTVAKDLTAAWDLDALLVKPVQRITRYQLLLKQIKSTTPDDHPDCEALDTCCQQLSKLLTEIDDLKKRIHVVAKIVGRKRKESDVRTGIAKAFGRRVEKLNLNPNRTKDDEEYLKMYEKFGDDYLRLQVVLRDAEFYSRQVSTYVSDHLRYFSAMELVMRMSPAGYSMIESKWVRFNISMREMGTHFIEDHINEVRKFVIEPFERTISAYNGPILAMKKRDKRRLDYEKALSLKNTGKKVDEKLQNLSNEYSALHETLKWELPKLSQLTETMGKYILGHFICIQEKWYATWVKKIRNVLEENELPKDISDIIETFHRDYKHEETRIMELGIVNGSFGSELSFKGYKSRSQSRRVSDVSILSPPEHAEAPFSNRLSANSSGFRVQSSTVTQSSSVCTQASSVVEAHVITRGAPSSPADRFTRPNTGRSFNSESGSRAISDVNFRRESGSTYGSFHEGIKQTSRPHSGLFHSALPMGENEETTLSRGSSRDRNISRGYTILYLAASLFEFNISATKQEAGYPYLTYQAGEIFDVIGEKGELWLAKNQDDTTDTVGWIWSKHFARLAAN
ncbi:BgTH12-00355 [Blumeria graminis f. sp. triticale]|uniref:BgTH12-00355 n=1 Tax=Blumeria graminis f. sp. triticale TaxID=1689686 RepID=A0A9W4D646_BLUGR|nr:BgTH12-00355 [Blumeria graminis f. sp. triticale]